MEQVGDWILKLFLKSPKKEMGSVALLVLFWKEKEVEEEKVISEYRMCPMESKPSTSSFGLNEQRLRYISILVEISRSQFYKYINEYIVSMSMNFHW